MTFVGVAEMRRRRAEIEARVLAALTHEWIGAIELSTCVGESWQVVSSTLQRLAFIGHIEGREVWRRADRCRVRRTHLYRRRQELAPPPSWLEPRIVPLQGGGAAKLIIGVGMKGWSVRD